MEELKDIIVESVDFYFTYKDQKYNAVVSVSDYEGEYTCHVYSVLTRGLNLETMEVIHFYTDGRTDEKLSKLGKVVMNIIFNGKGMVG